MLLKIKPLPSTNSKCTPVKTEPCFGCHSSCNKCNMKLMQQPGEVKLISKQKALTTLHFLYEDFLYKKGVKFFIFRQTRVFRITCFLLFKLYFVVNSVTAKSEIFSNIIKYFLQVAAKVAVNVLFQIRFFKIQLLVI